MNPEYFSTVNSLPFYLIVGGVILFITAICLVFIVKSYRAGLAIGMDKKVLKRAITSSATFTVLPSISILLGVIALSGTLGVPFSWLRLSVVGALQYELNVAEIAATGMGLSGLKATEMSMGSFVTIGLVMTVGILGGVLLCIFVLKKYLNKVRSKPKSGEESSKPGFGAYATIAMFIGLCSAYIGSYVGTFTAFGNFMPLVVAGVSALVMAIFEYFTRKKNMAWLDNFSVATSMLIGMIAAVLINKAM
ncbi:DUF5058 family protein [Anaerolentibacter hominis]|uniref:DUF5058 family protein n=1 Tax=Anaerolentibacter hominis TaxID=3079009 RepID=UPI0031B8A554